VLYEMITGRLPFRGDTDAGTLNSILNDTPEPLSRYKSNVPEQLQLIVTKLLEKNPAYRYQSAAGVLSDLKRLSSKPVQPVKVIDNWNRYVVPSALVILLAIFVIWKFGLKDHVPTQGETDKIMLAVLPFENLGDLEDEYFADGMTEEITTNLSKLSGLGVISRTSSMQYKNSNKNLKKIGKELKVDFILEGTIRWDKSSPENRVRINPQLIRVSDDMHLWAESYDAVLNDVFGLQSSIAREVATALDITLLQKENDALSLQYKIDPVAYDYYLRGKQYFSLEYAYHNQIDLARMMQEKAIEIAPDFALGYAELGAIHTEIYWTGVDPSSKRLDTAKQYIDKAMALAPNLSEVRQALGWYYYHGLRDFDRAVDVFKHVLELQPNNSLAIASIAWVHRRQGKWDEAIELQKQAIRLDPRKSGYRHELGNTLMYKRKYEEALKNYNLAIDLDPDHYWAFASKSWALLNRTGDVSQSLRVIEQALKNSGRKPTLTFFEVYYNLIEGNYEQALSLNSAPGEIYLWGDEGGSDYFYFKGAAYHLMKNENMAQIYFDSARVILEKLVSETPSSAPYFSALARVYASLGRKDDAIRTAKRAIEIEPVSVDALDGTDHIRALIIVYARVGEYDLAIAQLDYLLQIPSTISIKWAKIAPELAPLRDHPRFQALLKKYEKKEDY
ncbi:MAG TPA: tetratricopeptide repeat protein, partial [candidate division Zixibacteria bacterium]|nr:tetratricopeptide repeat protein [candidate division Zixibacteria bacterium]